MSRHIDCIAEAQRELGERAGMIEIETTCAWCGEDIYFDDPAHYDPLNRRICDDCAGAGGQCDTL